MNLSEMHEVLSQVKFRDWRVRLKVDGGDAPKYCNPSFGCDCHHSNRPYLQWSFMEEDMVSGRIEEQWSRKWFLSPYMTKSEVVSTAFKAALTAIEHETREQFRYKNRAIFGPHFDVDKMVDFAILNNIDCRTGRWVAA